MRSVADLPQPRQDGRELEPPGIRMLTRRPRLVSMSLTRNLRSGEKRITIELEQELAEEMFDNLGVLRRA
jgi:hypothetical protein